MLSKAFLRKFAKNITQQTKKNFKKANKKKILNIKTRSNNLSIIRKRNGKLWFYSKQAN